MAVWTKVPSGYDPKYWALVIRTVPPLSAGTVNCCTPGAVVVIVAVELALKPGNVNVIASLVSRRADVGLAVPADVVKKASTTPVAVPVTAVVLVELEEVELVLDVLGRVVVVGQMVVDVLELLEVLVVEELVDDVV